MDDFSFVGNSDIGVVESLYQQYKKDPSSVDPGYVHFFKGFDFALAHFNGAPGEGIGKEFNVINLIHGYRQRGHLFTKTNPVRARRQYFPTLDIENFGLSEADLDTVFQAGSQIGIGSATLRDIVDHLQETYCESIGVEYLYVRMPEVVTWLREKMESVRNVPNYDEERKTTIFRFLKRAVGFEAFVHKKFVGQKRFSLEGSEGLIPGLKALLNKGGELGAEEFVLGMAHRGRLNVLSNVLGKPYRKIFKEFVADEYDDNVSLGDVKYHLGYDNVVKTLSKEVRVSLLPNPSHLEAVTPVAEGLARARVDHAYDGDYDKVVPVIIHGDAAIAAQGVVYEVVQMAKLPGYKTGGTIHVVVNNQVGFTTNYVEARSSTYCTDVGKVTNSPVFHVNGDDAEAIVYVFELAMEFRQKFNSDVFIDILSYRKYGHNEGDEPRFTQPTLYKAIASHPNSREIYGKELVEQKVFTKTRLKELIEKFDRYLETEFEASGQIEKMSIARFMPDLWSDYKYPKTEDFDVQPKTGVSMKEIHELCEQLNQLPEEKNFFSKVHKILDERKKMISSGKADWAIAETMAYATLINDGHPVRLSGQDSERGTFAHRHASFTVEEINERYMPLRHLNDSPVSFNAFNSLLSEYGVLGFEYGYALGVPKGLTIWEAQFGDFFNVAQVVIDQYISSAEEKWGLMNGLVLYLPHGYEGQGPEHSSARIERFLNLSARNNIQVMNFTTPANLFHALRRQMKRDFMVPMVIFTPKSLLRHPKCISPLDDLEKGVFQEVIDDDNVDMASVTRLVFCTGKVYYDLLARKEELNARNVALVRIEQLHPFPRKAVTKILEKYKHVLLKLWVQEEPENMGAWTYIRSMLPDEYLVPVARLASASPATGLTGLHNVGQNELVNKVFKKCHCDLKLPYCNLNCMEGKTREEILKAHYYFDEKPRFSI
ncbi:2-oxoglutarate dehydrogenase E1 component [Geofilum rubicundum]|uniref:oxoglutarate dehydrogenase (succinyl-transferring) n=1 Tax=Geofilum rubicundum JCM 15548 TaxID=1236989 RepID=A0A0E9M079_9BACT|nr:2-oxoglutarate dehydrogenase E1 component [Geofilum rubicundum]GAO31237.1 2-oxoglutarate dehydrogenase E1 component [Geofilum rubicundum JCM 15548]